MEEINLYDLLRYYTRKWRVILACVGAGLLIGVVFNTFIQKPAYKSNATLLLVNPPNAQDSTMINNYIQLIKSRRVLDPVIDQEKLDISYEDLSQNITATSSKDTQVIKLSVVNSQPSETKRTAERVIETFKRQVKEIYKADNTQVVDTASMPEKPYNVNKPLQLLLATAAGFILSIIGLFFAYDFSHSKRATATPSQKPRRSFRLSARLQKARARISRAMQPQTPTKPPVKATSSFDENPVSAQPEQSVSNVSLPMPPEPRVSISHTTPQPPVNPSATPSSDWRQAYRPASWQQTPRPTTPSQNETTIDPEKK